MTLLSLLYTCLLLSCTTQVVGGRYDVTEKTAMAAYCMLYAG